MKNQVIIYDLETTGLNIHKNKIIEIYLYNVGEKTCRHILINPNVNIPPETIKIHGLTNMDLQGKPLFKDIVDDIYEFVGEEPYMISHNNISFDKQFLESEMKRANLPTPTDWKYIDTLFIARELYELKNYKQDTLREKFNISNKGSHRANKDVIDLSIIFENMIKDSQKTIEELYKMTQNYCYDKMPFGKHKNVNIKDLPDDYVNWMIKKNVFKNKPILKKSFLKAKKIITKKSKSKQNN